MRFVAIGLATTSFLALAACGGSGGAGSVQGLGSVAPPASVTPTPATSTPTPTTTAQTPAPTASTPTPSPTPTSTLPTIPKVDVSTLTPNPVTLTPSGAHFLDTTAVVTSDAIGGFHSLSIASNDLGSGSLYAGNASTIGSPGGTVAYNPRDGIFTLTLADDSASVTKTLRFQDPAHRTDFNPLRRPYNEVPDYGSFNYLIAADDLDDRATFFYQRPSAVTQYVTLGGFKHRKANDDGSSLVMRGAFAFGTKTSHLQIPIMGSGSFAGNFLATMVRSGSFDNKDVDTYVQWMSGTSAVDVNFASRAVTFGLNGKVGQTFVNDVLVSDDTLTIKTGAAFTAAGTATLDATRDFFSGKFSSAGFTVNGQAIPINFQSVNPANSTAGASSIDGTFYGPNAAEVGGSFRVIGGVPDMRVDILGGFTGKR